MLKNVNNAADFLEMIMAATSVMPVSCLRENLKAVET